MISAVFDKITSRHRISNTPIVRIEILPLPQSGGEIYCIFILCVWINPSSYPSPQGEGTTFPLGKFDKNLI